MPQKRKLKADKKSIITKIDCFYLILVRLFFFKD